MGERVVAVYLTFPDEASAERVARVLVEARLAACVNVLPGARSVYRWEGDVLVEPEVVAIAKTTADRVAALAEAVRAAHPFDLPCVVAYPAVAGLEAYLDWVRDETRPDETRSDASAAAGPGDDPASP
jgi:periplasmic divalent cation tolerance protein